METVSKQLSSSSLLMQGARGFPGTPGLPGMKGHRVSAGFFPA